MKIADVAKLPPLEQFLYWVRERHQIHLRRRAGLPKPWTDDEIMQCYFFTNPYRENDKVTVWFKENIREPLRNSSKVLMATIIFRWFNYPPTGEILIREGLHLNWDRKKAFKVLDAERKKGNKIFTGAFMINSPKGEGKLEAITRRVSQVWLERQDLVEFFTRKRPKPLSMQEAHKRLSGYEGHGKFMSYEVVCDLRYTYLLENAPDKLTWCNPGPGAVRGLLRILDRPFKRGDNSATPPLPDDWDEQLQKMLKTVQRRLKSMPPFEMREIEHSLCETDKYLRALNGTTEGRMKRRYKGV